MSAGPPWGRITIAGLGLIGSSLARAIRRGRLAREIVVLDASARVRAAASALGLADRAEADPAAAVEGAELLVLATPVRAFAEVVAAAAPALAPGAIVTDVGSVKAHVVETLAPLLPAHVHLVPGHPVAGTEQSGPEAGFAELFENRWCILTPPAGADPAAVARVRGLWEAIGARVETMTPEHHDRVLAITSHLPHLIAFTIVGTASDLEQVTRSEVMTFSAGGFRDFTRIAASDPTMWRDVFLTNREAVLELLGRFTEDLIALQRAIRWGEGDALFAHFERVRDIRRGILALGQDTDAPDFGRRAAARRADDA